MSRALNFLLIGSLLQGALCGNEHFKTNMPQSVQVLSGSCVTIPCSFEISSDHEKNLDGTCKALWTTKQSKNNENEKLTSCKEMRGNLKQKDCTTTFNNMSGEYNNTYYFRLECNNALKWTFGNTLNISVKSDPPSLSLTPSTLEVKEGTSVSLMCSAPAPCWSHPPTLTWTPNLGESVETLQEKQDKTKVQTSVMNFTASHLHHGMKISCTAVYKKQDGSSDASAEASLTPSVSYPPQNTTVSVSPSGPAPENSKVTLTCSSNANPAVKNYSWFRADGDQEAFIGTGPILNTEASKFSRVFLCKAQNEFGVGCSNLTQVDVQFTPQILTSSDCDKTAGQIKCACETVGNPSPTVQWYLNGQPVNQSGKSEIFKETLNSTALRGFFMLNQPHEKDLSSLLCHSFNSLGSATQQFCVKCFQISAEHQGPVLYLATIATLSALLLVLIFVLLLFIRAQKNHQNPKGQFIDENNTVATGQLLNREGNQAPNTMEECIYSNTVALRVADTVYPTTSSESNTTNLPSSGPNNAEGASKSSEKNEDGCDVTYSSVNWKSKSKKKKGQESVDTNPSGSSILEEKCMVGGNSRNFMSNALEMENLYDEVQPRNVRKGVECEYAQVNFKGKSAMQK